MKEIYRAAGSLNRGFVGQIAYTVCLEEEFRKLDIHFSFDPEKRRYTPEEITDEFVEENLQLVKEKYGLAGTPEAMRGALLREGKTELHVMAELNGEFIGCVHKQLDDRHMVFDGDFASEGCLPQEKIGGVLRVTILAFNVIKDDTGYQLEVSAE